MYPHRDTTGADLGGGCRGCAPPPRHDLRFSNTTGILKKKNMWFIGVEVEQETSAPPPKKNPGSAPVQFSNCTRLKNTKSDPSTVEGSVKESEKNITIFHSFE